MRTDLSISGGNSVSLVKGGDLGDLIKPMIREIHLFDSFIAGTTHLSEQTPLQEMQKGDELTLQREDNQFDTNAILLLDARKRKTGYVPEKDNVIFARLMDAGKLLKAKVSDMEPRGSFTLIRIGIYLVDL